MPAALATRAPAKINLTLHVLGRRADGYHELESLVAFAATGDALSLTPGRLPRARRERSDGGARRPGSDNLVLKAARLLAERFEGLRLGQFHLVKRLPVAAGIGGGSSDAAAALRLLARLNGLSLGDPRLRDAARCAGSDVPVCLEPRARLMRGAGEDLGPALALPRLHAVLVNPGVPSRPPPFSSVSASSRASACAGSLTRPSRQGSEAASGTEGDPQRAQRSGAAGPAGPARHRRSPRASSPPRRPAASPACRAPARRCLAFTTTAMRPRRPPRS